MEDFLHILQKELVVNKDVKKIFKKFKKKEDKDT